MGLLIGFFLGVLSSVLASVLISAVPRHRQQRFLALLRNPSLYLRLMTNSEERAVAELLRSLFQAWERKDVESYLRCWSPSAIRIIGTRSEEVQSGEVIRDQFLESCQRYIGIRVASLVFHDVQITGPERSNALAFVRYRFELARAIDSLPVAEESSDVYALRKIDGAWRITSNVDHYYEIIPSPTA